MKASLSNAVFQMYGLDEKLLPAQQQPHQPEPGAALQTGAGDLPLLDRGETARGSVQPDGVPVLLLVLKQACQWKHINIYEK